MFNYSTIVSFPAFAKDIKEGGGGIREKQPVL